MVRREKTYARWWILFYFILFGFTILFPCRGVCYTIDGFVDTWGIDIFTPKQSGGQTGQTGYSSGKLRLASPGSNKTSTLPRSGGSPSLTPVDPSAELDPQRLKYEHAQSPLLNLLDSADLVIALLTLSCVMMILIVRRHYFEAKRIFDIAFSIVALAVCFPIMLLIALAVKLDSSGPIFIRQVRVGVNRRGSKGGLSFARERRGKQNLGCLFTIYKFRTMRADAETKSGPVWAKENDDRITRVGRILRKTHLDELPQFANVLKGDMCIIGPRPERPIFINQLQKCIPNYDKRLQVKPGITGLAQVRYRYAASTLDAKIKLRYDLLYIRKMCFLLDFGILLNTLNIIISTKGAR
jgi:lipopolysaccharide/colanic/teichoic acid biosynthesis glycosyltransferase